MARRVKSAIMDSREARKNLSVRDKPHYVTVDRGLHLGYRKGKRGGKWVARCYVDGDYSVQTFAVADDNRDQDGVTVFDFWQAQARARTICQELHHRALGIETTQGPYTVARAMDDYLEWLFAEKKSGPEAENQINALIKPDIGKIECAKLTTKKIKDWHHKLSTTPPRLRTREGEAQKHADFDPSDPEAVRKRKSRANRVLTTLKAGLNQAWRDGKIPSDDAWRRVRPFKKVDAARTRWLKKPEARRLINACEPDLRGLVHGALATGARYGELAAMTCRDYDHDTHQVHVCDSKSGDARYVILNDEGVALLDRLTAGRPADSLIFRKTDGTRWLKSHQTRPFRDACARAKIDPPIAFHGLRHTYASLAIMAGAPLMVVAENLGHRDTRMVEHHYGHLARKYVAEMIRKTAPTFGIDEPTSVERLGA